MPPTSLLVIYTLLATSHCLLADSKPTFRRVSKPLLMPVLLAFYLLAGGAQAWVMVALLGAWLGDIALLKFSNKAFITGLLSFLIGHVAMTVAIYELIPHGASIPWTGIAAVKLGMACTAFWYLKPKLGSLRLPVLIYCLVLASKGMLAMGLLFAHYSPAALMLTIGAIMFMASDLLLAINRFAHPLHKAHFWVMSTYTLAQALIVMALLQLS